MRVAFICGILFLALPSAVGIVTSVRGHPEADLALVVDVLARAGVLLLFVLAALLVLVRLRPLSKTPGLQPRLSALAGSVLLMTMTLFPRHNLPTGLNLLSAGLIFLGHALAVLALAWLGRSFSIMAEARRLVIEWPYAAVGHPLYAGEVNGALGLFLPYASPWTTLLTVVSLGFQLRRMRNEEEVPGASFPEYAAYAARMRRLPRRVLSTPASAPTARHLSWPAPTEERPPPA